MTENEGPSKKSIIIDIGSGYCKAGFGEEEFPSKIFPSVIGYPFYPDLMKGANQKDFYIGLEAKGKENILKLSHPVEHGTITNWEDMEKIWQYCFSKVLRTDPKDKKIFITEPPMNPKNYIEKIATIMFEKFACGEFYIEIQSILSLFSEGKFSGIVLDLGDDTTSFTPIYNGHSFPHAMNKVDFAGRFLTEYLSKLLTEIGQKFETEAEMEIVKDIKENICYVALDFSQELNKGQEIQYELPDGKIIKIGSQGFRCTECLFQPELAGKEQDKGIGYKTMEAINKCSKDIHKDLYNNIVLSGGTSMFRGLPERLLKEIKNNSSEDMKDSVKIHFSNERKYSAWIGASVLTSMSTFDHMWITKREYEESGPAVVSHKMMVNTFGINKDVV